MTENFAERKSPFRPRLVETQLDPARQQWCASHRLDRLGRALHVQEAIFARVWQQDDRHVFSAVEGEVKRDEPADPMRTYVRQVMSAASQPERASQSLGCRVAGRAAARPVTTSAEAAPTASPLKRTTGLCGAGRAEGGPAHLGATEELELRADRGEAQRSSCACSGWRCLVSAHGAAAREAQRGRAMSGPELPPLHLDARAEDADWIKAGFWDISAHNVHALREWLMGQRINPSDFKTWPVYLGNVDRPGMEWLRDL
jgi:hypothetical protein